MKVTSTVCHSVIMYFAFLDLSPWFKCFALLLISGSDCSKTARNFLYKFCLATETSFESFK
jgi:hypothetical protein